MWQWIGMLKPLMFDNCEEEYSTPLYSGETLLACTGKFCIIIAKILSYSGCTCVAAKELSYKKACVAVLTLLLLMLCFHCTHYP